MTQPSLLELAKQGNPKAIAALMNRSLQPKGITAKVALNNGCLQVMLESAQVPPTALVTVIRRGLINIGIEPINQVKVYGRQLSKKIPEWSEEIELVFLPNLTTSQINAYSSVANNQTQDLKNFLTSTSQSKKPRVKAYNKNHNVDFMRNLTLIFLRVSFGTLGFLGLITSLLILIALLYNSLAISVLGDLRKGAFFILIILMLMVFSWAYIYFSFFLKTLLIKSPKFITTTLWLIVGNCIVLFFYGLTKITTLAGSNTIGYIFGLILPIFLNSYFLYSVRRLSLELKLQELKFSRRRITQPNATSSKQSNHLFRIQT